MKITAPAFVSIPDFNQSFVVMVMCPTSVSVVAKGGFYDAYVNSTLCYSIVLPFRNMLEPQIKSLIECVQDLEFVTDRKINLGESVLHSLSNNDEANEGTGKGRALDAGVLEKAPIGTSVATALLGVLYKTEPWLEGTWPKEAPPQEESVLAADGDHLAERTLPTSLAAPLESRTQAEHVLEGLLKSANCGSIAELLRGCRESDRGVFRDVMETLKPELKKDTWERNPAIKNLFSWTLHQVTRPWLCDYLDSVLPPSLLFSDDFRTENKILGVRCLHHIILNVPAAELLQFNRAQVLYHALYNHLYTAEADLIQVVLSCLIDLFPVLEKFPQANKDAVRQVRYTNDVLQLMLIHMEMEHKILLRRVYAQHLPAFVERLGIGVVRHLKRLERVFVGYLEVYDGPEEAARLSVLITLKCTIRHAWPRMSCRLGTLLKALLRFMYDVSTDCSLTPTHVKSTLLQEATECLILLDRCTQRQVKVLLDGITLTCTDSQVLKCLDKVKQDI